MVPEYDFHDNVLSNEERGVFEIVNFVSICSIVSLFGIASNIVNIIIFYKQGFKITANIGFFGLAISDLCSLASLLWASICMNPLLGSSEAHWYPLEIMYLSGSWPHVCFSRITSFITVYLTAERYLSIALPLKIKHIITPRLTTLILCLIYLVNLATLVPEYATSYLGWRYIPARNKTLIALVFTSSRRSVEGVVYVFHSMLGMASFAGVILFTALLVTTLGQSSEKRKQMTSTFIRQIHVATSKRDNKIVKMVVIIASVMIACYTPGVLISVATLIVGPEFDIKGKYINICEAMWSVAFSFQSINSSANIFLYYAMSSRYRQTLNDIFLPKDQRHQAECQSTTQK